VDGGCMLLVQHARCTGWGVTAEAVSPRGSWQLCGTADVAWS
jgi:hypothetical protein